MSNEYETIAVEHDGPVATVRVARPESMNAVNTEVLTELADAISTAETDARVVVLTGEGDRAFIGGGDIKEFQGQSGMWFRGEFRDRMADLEDAIESGRVPVIAAVNGIALGGGTEIAMMCDMIVATESAVFGQPEIGLGFIPGAGGTQRLTHLVGYMKAKELILTGRQVAAEEAVDIGLANEVVDDDAFDDRISELATDLANGPPLAQWFAKKAVNQCRADIERGLELEAALGALLFETEDNQEGLTAFIEKRDAEFRGR
ncbi:enoyl-CoA hydratase/isomerase family protein [Halomarina ordinaria]|uniref:Enoyl-CoA hydratase/isomerase family protein n=1 Tax=Halomarina ordinaria TaxID=3033939 RepID=A0ABD5UCP9_9EURY|nr:enoyl-CoA hydratase-related protein [Halomarina sp. PSRA2]